MKVMSVVLLLCAAVTAPVVADAQPHPDSPPRVDTSGVNQQPNYPLAALLGRESGAVFVDVKVRADGSVKKVSLHQSSGYADLDAAAMNAAMHWKYLPAIEHGSAVDGQMTVQISFQPPS